MRKCQWNPLCSIQMWVGSGAWGLWTSTNQGPSVHFLQPIGEQSSSQFLRLAHAGANMYFCTVIIWLLLFVFSLKAPLSSDSTGAFNYSGSSVTLINLIVLLGRFSRVQVQIRDLPVIIYKLQLNVPLLWGAWEHFRPVLTSSSFSKGTLPFLLLETGPRKVTDRIIVKMEIGLRPW